MVFAVAGSVGTDWINKMVASTLNLDILWYFILSRLPHSRLGEDNSSPLICHEFIPCSGAMAAVSAGGILRRYWDSTSPLDHEMGGWQGWLGWLGWQGIVTDDQPSSPKCYDVPGQRNPGWTMRASPRFAGETKSTAGKTHSAKKPLVDPSGQQFAMENLNFNRSINYQYGHVP